MKGRVWITRTEPGASKTAQAVAALGYEPVIAPVLAVRRLKPVFDPHGFDALIFTSRNALDAFCDLCPRRDLPVWCVGAVTASAARQHGFERVISGDSDARTLSELIVRDAASGLRLFHPTAQAPAFAMADALRAKGVTVSEAAVYETVPLTPALPRPQTLTHALIHSPRAAAPVVQTLVQNADAPALIFIAISPAAAQALEKTLAAAPQTRKLARAIRISAFPDEASMLQRLDEA
ncbi:MAG: uroporphyrinogen-III synthase [Asticcacaulis sp.]|uniref:uroporphyrinogen-III synthase n=1 Tax=Asticcacaulis sp. TaxID=1872648 RepID=UPI003F7C7F48